MHSGTSPAPAPLLLVEGLVKRYGEQLAVAGVDLAVPPGAFVTLLGPSGCGKTTILRCIAGFERADTGSIRLDGREIGGLPPERRPVNTVFQSYALFPHLTVARNVGFALAVRGAVGRDDARIRRALRTVRMEDFADRYPHELSGGQQQRIAVARALVAEPLLLLLDEPFSALDRGLRGHLQLELKALQRGLGTAFLHVTHDQEEAFALSDLLVVMNAGRIAQMGSPQEVYGRPADSFVANFLGEASLVPGRVLEAREHAVLETALGIVEAPFGAPLSVGERAVLVLRPEQLRLGGRGPWRARVRQLVYRGDRFLVDLEADGIGLAAYAAEPIAPGSEIVLGFEPERACITRLAA
jgi:spermidine/putrescine transport system ATP-binding protein